MTLYVLGLQQIDDLSTMYPASLPPMSSEMDK